MLLEISGEITPERVKRRSQSRTNTPAVDVTVIEVKSDAIRSVVRSNIA